MVSVTVTQQQQQQQHHRRDYAWEETLSVTEAIREAMESTSSSARGRPSTLRELPATEPHLPLRKAEPRRLHAKQGAPRPLWTNSQHQGRGFHPSPVQPLPHVDNVTASNEHAFAGRDDSRRRPFKPPLGVQALKHGYDTSRGQHAADRPSSSRVEGRPPPSPFLSQPPSPHEKRLRSSKSLGDGLKGLRHRFSQPSSPHERPHIPNPPYASNPPSHRPSMASMATEHVRESFKSALTSNSSLLNTSSINTEQSSMTGNSSHSDFVTVYPDWPGTDREEGDVSVDDVLGMYEDGFSSAKPSMDTAVRQSLHVQSKRSFQENRPASQPSELLQTAKQSRMGHRRSQSASLLDRFQRVGGDSLAPEPRSSVDGKRKSGARPERMFDDLDGTSQSSPRPVTQFPGARATPQPTTDAPRDRHGFKKASNYYTIAQYDAWNRSYSVHLERRRDKWHKLMKSYGLSIEKPFRFPPKSDKIKRYVRKGIPADLRGAAWFWYGGGPQMLKDHPGLYHKLLERVEQGDLSDNDREHIERDLNRTFPDNVRFKPDPTTTLDAQSGAGGGGAEADGTARKPSKKGRHTTDPETPILQSLRRVLQAFAVHNPDTGYCQSLNFIAGLLLLFLDTDEEKAFILLNIVTSVHLPGTHGVALEGANIDIAVLMSCIKDSLPAVWAKLDDKGGVGTGPVAEALRLPTVSLATTAWFMSLFVGTLPIEAVLRVWDCLFFEGSKTLFRIALAIFKHGQSQILAVSDPMEVFQLVQTIPRGLLDVNGLLEVCFKRRGGFGHLSQDMIERRRAERRALVKAGVAGVQGEVGWLRRLGKGRRS